MRDFFTALILGLCWLTGAFAAGAQTTPAEPPFVPDLNFDKSSDRVLTLGKRATVDGRVTVDGCGSNYCFRVMIPERLDADNAFMSLADGILYSGSATISKENFIDGTYNASQFRSASPTISRSSR